MIHLWTLLNRILLKTGVTSIWDHDMSILPGKVSDLSQIASELVSDIDILHEVSPTPAGMDLFTYTLGSERLYSSAILI
jgi:hypothetical protein